jgi:hypothetical protein
MRWRAGVVVLSGALVAAEPFTVPAHPVPPLDPDHAELAVVLTQVVRPAGVDYAALRRDPRGLERYLNQLAAAPLPTGREATLALYINAYNAATLALVVRHLPADQASWPAWSITSLQRDGLSAWQRFAVGVAGQRLTLDGIEHAILRPLGDPRIHFAVNCASRSCPALAAEPYRAATIDAQLEAATVAFANDRTHLRAVPGAIEANAILGWFAADFAPAGGAAAFLAPRVGDDALRAALAQPGELRVLAYDWSLNLAPEVR